MKLVVALWLGMNLLKWNTSPSFHSRFFIWWRFLPVLVQLHSVHQLTAGNDEVEHHAGGHSLPHLLGHLPAWHLHGRLTHRLTGQPD